MKHAAIAKIKQFELKRSAAAARARAVSKAAWDNQKHTMIVSTTGYSLGYAESKGMVLPTVDGIDPTALYAALAFGATMFVKDAAFKRIAEGITNGLLGIALYKAGRNGFTSLFNYQKPVPVPSTGVIEEADVNF